MKIIKDYPNYAITIDSKVYNIKTNKLLKQNINGRGYYQVNLFNNKVSNTLRVHRLLMEAYYPINEKLDVNHIDGNKLNNKLSNLEWVTRRENIKHAYRIGLSKGVYAPKLVLDKQTGIFYESLLEASNSFYIKYEYLKSMLSGNSKNKTSLIYV